MMDFPLVYRFMVDLAFVQECYRYFPTEDSKEQNDWSFINRLGRLKEMLLYPAEETRLVYPFLSDEQFLNELENTSTQFVKELYQLMSQSDEVVKEFLQNIDKEVEEKIGQIFADQEKLMDLGFNLEAVRQIIINSSFSFSLQSLELAENILQFFTATSSRDERSILQLSRNLLKACTGLTVKETQIFFSRIGIPIPEPQRHVRTFVNGAVYVLNNKIGMHKMAMHKNSV